MWRANSLEKTLMLGKIAGRRRRRWQRTRWLDAITDSMDMSLSKFQVMMEDREACCAAAMGSQKSGMTEWLNNIKTWRSQYPQFYHITSLMYRILFFPSQCPHFNISHPTKLGVSLHCYSARMKFWIWFSAVSKPGLQDIHVPCSPNTEAFSSWAGNLNPWAPPSLLSFLSSSSSSHQTTSLSSLCSKNIPRYIQASSSNKNA